MGRNGILGAVAPLDPSYPRDRIYDEKDLPPGSAWNIPELIDNLSRGIVPADFAAFRRFFDRDPQRTPPAETDAIVAPADGLLELEPKGPMLRLIVHLRLTDVHVQRVPFAGTVASVERGGSGFFYPNEAGYWGGVHAATSIDSPLGRYTVVQLTNMLTRRLETYLAPGQPVKTGDRLGRIRLGSTVYFELPAKVRLAAQNGQRVVGGETILARY
jgi:phosphatidylserine decarboxylase